MGWGAEKDTPFCPHCGTGFLGPSESRLGTSPESLFVNECPSHGTSVGSGLDTRDIAPSLLILSQPAEGIGTKSWNLGKLPRCALPPLPEEGLVVTLALEENPLVSLAGL